MWNKAWMGVLIVCAQTAFAAESSDANPAYAAMAPLAQYLPVSDAEEIALAKSAAPPSISANAEVLVLGPQGYKTAVRGDNGFVCLVQRSWAASFADKEFWNPNLRAPICHNRAAARTVHPTYLERTTWVLSGMAKTEMMDRTRTQVHAKKFMLPEAGAMSYMLSKQGHLNDADGHWHPHVMLCFAHVAAAGWGANLDGSPILADSGPIFSQEGQPEPMTTFFIPVARWSDGTPET
jgi:hypothetical protein